jgi:hypothetical protein
MLILWLCLLAAAGGRKHLASPNEGLGMSLKPRQQSGEVGAVQLYRRANHACKVFQTLSTLTTKSNYRNIATIVDKRVFIDGGEYSYESGGSLHFTYG